MDLKVNNELADIVLAWVRAHRKAAAGVAAVVVVILLVIVFAASFASSIQHLRSDGKQLSSEYHQLKECVLAGDGEGAIEKAEVTRTLAEAIDRETDRWIWSAVGMFSGPDGDVEKARTLADINLRLANDATVPFARAYAQFAKTGILTDSGAINPLALAANPDAVSELLVNLKSLRSVISECNLRVKQLGTANNPDLEQVIESASDTLGQLDSSFSALDTALSTAGTIGDTIASLLP